jgi:SH3-like domain-containing protein
MATMMRAQFPAFTIANQHYAAAIAAAFLFGGLLGTMSPSALAQAPVAERSTPATTAQPTPAAKSTPTQPANGSVAPATSATPPPVPPAPVKAFVSIGDKLAIMFDAPSMRANKIFIISAYTPLEILVKLDKLTKVRDAEGTVGWVENSTLGERRHVQISAASADVRAAGAATAALVFEAQRSVVLEVTGPAQDGWLPVKHRDGQSGFVRLTQVWGD